MLIILINPRLLIGVSGSGESSLLEGNTHPVHKLGLTYMGSDRTRPTPLALDDALLFHFDRGSALLAASQAWPWLETRRFGRSRQCLPQRGVACTVHDLFVEGATKHGDPHARLRKFHLGINKMIRHPKFAGIHIKDLGSHAHQPLLRWFPLFMAISEGL